MLQFPACIPRVYEQNPHTENERLRFAWSPVAREKEPNSDYVSGLVKVKTTIWTVSGFEPIDIIV